MTPQLDFELSESGPLTREVRRLGFSHFLTLAEHVRQLPYGRPADPGDFLAVLKEKRGTCSFKHRLLAAIAHECGHSEVELVVGLYGMSEQNTPGVGVVLDEAGFGSIPEAHCYLRLGSRRYDFTGVSAGRTSPFDALLSEHVICPERLTEEKKSLHQEAIGFWARDNDQSFGDAWALREACIQALASSSARPIADVKPFREETVSQYHIAQLNIATLVSPIDSPQLADFVANLDRINALAEASAGFVWRLQTEDGDATGIDYFGSDRIVNLSVWDSVEALHRYVYQSAHVEIMRRKKEWFHKMREAHMVLWWVPAGHIPSVEEAAQKLNTLQEHGPTREAFTFRKAYPPPGVSAQSDARPAGIS